MQHFNLILIEKTPNKFILIVYYSGRERSGSVVECLTQDRRARVRASTASLRCGPSARHIYPSLLLVQPGKTCPFITEILLMGRKESNQSINQFITQEKIFR